MTFNNYKAVIFDFDGTLVDSMGLWHDIDRIYLKRHGQTCPKDLSYEITGKSFTETAEYFKKRFSISDSVDHIMNEWIEMSHDNYLNHITFKPGALAFLEYLHTKYKKIAIATSNNRNTTEAYLKKHGILDYFDALCFTCEVSAGKPDPAVFLKAAELLTVSPSECLVFEDTFEGIQAAKAANMDAIAISDLWQGTQVAKIKALADAYIQDFNSLDF
ncbi:MAG: HAD family phosphatase [Eubacterium sp.]